MLNRFSSRKTDLGADFLSKRLQGAVSYDRIAGYFRSSALEIAGEAMEQEPVKIRVVCNGDLSAAVPLCDFVISDIARIANRVPLTLKGWREQSAPDVAPAVVEEPLYRKESGLWPYQQSFVSRAFREHQTPSGARLILADMVGLGKTLQRSLGLPVPDRLSFLPPVPVQLRPRRPFRIKPDDLYSCPT